MIKLILSLFVIFLVQVHSNTSDNKTNIQDIITNNTSVESRASNEKHDTTPSKLFLLFHHMTPANLTLEERIELEKNTWHWFPYKRIDYYLSDDGTVEEAACEKPSSIDDFPTDLFTQEQRLQGAILFHFIGAIYFFSILAVVCSDYFIPSVECICEDLKLTQDVAAATFMATATTMPEFFTNTISTFIAVSDMGLGTIIGSMLFNTLGVAALAGIFASRPVQLDWWPLTRDIVIFSVNISVLAAISWDGRVDWHESLILVILYLLYFMLMFQNKRMMKFVRKYVEEKWRCCSRRAQYDLETPEVPDIKKKESKTIENVENPAIMDIINSRGHRMSEIMSEKPMKLGDLEILASHVIEEEPDMSLWVISRGTVFQRIWWWYSWPIRFVLTYTIPNPVIFRRYYPLTFIMCIVWLASTSYMIFWMVSVIGYTFGIPEAVMGLFFLAAGGCLPEAVSAIIITRSGSGAMGVSNSLGANSLNILFSLGVPWFIRTSVNWAEGGDTFVNIFTYGIQYTLLSLLGAGAALYICIFLAGYRLKKLVGLALIICYCFFASFALLVQLDIFFTDGEGGGGC